MLRKILATIRKRIAGIFSKNSDASAEISIRCNSDSNESESSGCSVIFIALNVDAEDEKIFGNWIQNTSGVKSIIISRGLRITDIPDNQLDEIINNLSKAKFIYMATPDKCGFTLPKIPVFFGPQCKGKQLAEELKALGAAFITDTPSTFNRIANRLLYNPVEYQRRAKWAADYRE